MLNMQRAIVQNLLLDKRIVDDGEGQDDDIGEHRAKLLRQIVNVLRDSLIPIRSNT